MAILWPFEIYAPKKKLPYPLKDNQFNICKAFNQNVQHPHATIVTH